MWILREVWHSIKVHNITCSDLLQTASIINCSRVALGSLGSPSKLAGKDGKNRGKRLFVLICVPCWWCSSLWAWIENCKPSKASGGIRKEDSMQELDWNTQAASVKPIMTPPQSQFSDTFTSQIHLTELLGIPKESPFIHLPMFCCMPGLCQQSFLSRMHSFQSTSPAAFPAPKLLSLIKNYPLLSQHQCWGAGLSITAPSWLKYQWFANLTGITALAPLERRRKKPKKTQRNKPMQKVLQ